MRIYAWECEYKPAERNKLERDEAASTVFVVVVQYAQSLDKGVEVTAQ